MFLFNHKDFTFVEIMIVCVIIGVLTALAVPSYRNMRLETNRTMCIVNLREIDTAVEQWAVVNTTVEGMELTPHENEIYSLIHGGRPVCPSGGAYTLTRLGRHPHVRCNITGHELE